MTEAYVSHGRVLGMSVLILDTRYWILVTDHCLLTTGCYEVHPLEILEESMTPKRFYKKIRTILL